MAGPGQFERGFRAPFPGPTLARSLPALARDLVEALRSRGRRAWIVGGALRDGWLGLPADASDGRDHDLATDARPEEIELCARAAVGRPPDEAMPALGSYRWRLGPGTDGEASDGVPGEVAITTLRAEGGYRDHRRPDRVTFVDDVAVDAARRDFTINAIYAELPGGDLVDPLGAGEDVRLRRLRCIGEPAKRLLEDPVRLLRAVRFACRCDLAVEADTAAVLEEHGAAALFHVSDARRAREVELGLAFAGAVECWREFDRLGWRDVLLPEFAGEPGLAAQTEDLLRELTSSDAPGGRRATTAEVWLAVTAPLGLAAADAVLRRASLPRRTVDLVGRGRRLLRAARESKEPPAFVGRLGGHADDPVFSLVGRLLDPADPALSRIGTWRAVHRVASALTGKEVIAAGIRPGPAVGSVLRELRAELLAHGVADLDSGRAVLRSVVSRHQGDGPPGR
jgi:tRNA nucleotidyltransferase/poly(A) polymerase